MASEVIYAEVKFKNAPPKNSPPAAVPPETKKHEHHPQKYPSWLPWLISLLLFLVCIVLVALLVAPFFRGSDQHTVPERKFTECECTLVEPQGTEQGWICCPKGWKHFQKSCYYRSADKMSWTESVQNCTGMMGSHLVVINSKEEQVFLNEMLQPAPRKVNFYIGLYAEEVGQWQWVDQTPLNETAVFWRKGEPSNVSVEKCGVIHTISEIHNWNDARCEEHYRICEVAALTLMERPSS